ncbi:winged helix-turn-helix domain-containing protein [Streptomyces sp. NPDC021093]|uniref:winged helix-turn-helix domain-containing protein n=1 Tax=Streptomyces sp. NPDC021093 TaxID=3365112 RepID=UPI0037BD95D8
MSTTRSSYPGLSPELGLPELQRADGPPAPWGELAGATWFEIPESALPAPPGRPPLAGYLVLVPTDVEALATPPAAGPPTAPPPAGQVAEQQIQVDTETRTVAVAGSRLHFTRLEFDLLAHLVAHPWRVHTRERLHADLWGRGYPADHRTVDVHIARLRRKLGSPYRKAIETVRGVGYRYVT